MQITLQTDYAIRIINYLARNNDFGSAKQISGEMSIPLRFTKNILQKLAGTEILNSYKGVYGGYMLAKSPEDISLYDVLLAMDEQVLLSRCLKEDYTCTCSGDKQCTYYHTFMQLSGEMENSLRKARFSSKDIIR